MSIYENDFPELFAFIREGKVAIGYMERFREFYISLPRTNACQLIHFCPWTGKPLPASVRDQYFEVLENPNLTPYAVRKLKREMAGEAWWIARGL